MAGNGTSPPRETQAMFNRFSIIFLGAAGLIVAATGIGQYWWGQEEPRPASANGIEEAVVEPERVPDVPVKPAPAPVAEAEQPDATAERERIEPPAAAPLAAADRSPRERLSASEPEPAPQPDDLALGEDDTPPEVDEPSTAPGRPPAEAAPTVPERQTTEAASAPQPALERVPPAEANLAEMPEQELEQPAMAVPPPPPVAERPAPVPPERPIEREVAPRRLGSEHAEHEPSPADDDQLAALPDDVDPPIESELPAADATPPAPEREMAELSPAPPPVDERRPPMPDDLESSIGERVPEEIEPSAGPLSEAPGEPSEAPLEPAPDDRRAAEPELALPSQEAPPAPPAAADDPGVAAAEPPAPAPGQSEEPAVAAAEESGLRLPGDVDEPVVAAGEVPPPPPGEIEEPAVAAAPASLPRPPSEAEDPHVAGTPEPATLADDEPSVETPPVPAQRPDEPREAAEPRPAAPEEPDEAPARMAQELPADQAPVPVAPRPGVAAAPEAVEPAAGPEPATVALPIEVSSVHFNHGSSYLSPGGIMMVEQTVATLAELDGQYRIEVVGFTDTVGPVDFNVWLAERRANRVIDALVDRGVPRDRLLAVPRGPFDLPVPTGDGVSEPLNRAAAVKLVGTR
jgi:outer membrane protein OmpA-like peptidoglycan-associated protein